MVAENLINEILARLEEWYPEHHTFCNSIVFTTDDRKETLVQATIMDSHIYLCFERAGALEPILHIRLQQLLREKGLYLVPRSTVAAPKGIKYIFLVIAEPVASVWDDVLFTPLL